MTLGSAPDGSDGGNDGGTRGRQRGESHMAGRQTVARAAGVCYSECCSVTCCLLLVTRRLDRPADGRSQVPRDGGTLVRGEV